VATETNGIWSYHGYLVSSQAPHSFFRPNDLRLKHRIIRIETKLSNLEICNSDEKQNPRIS
jgi:hypothetical protein